MKKAILFLLLLCFINTTALADTAISQGPVVSHPPITQAQNIAFENCTKMFAVNKEKLFYLTLGAISANRFNVDEIQSESGYVIFSVAKNKYLVTIAGIDASNSILKITPCNDVYIFPPGILINMYKYIELNINTEIK